MSYSTYIDPNTGKRAMGSLDENGCCFLNADSKLEKFFKDPRSLQLLKTDPALYQSAPDFFIPESTQLSPFDQLFSTQTKPLETEALERSDSPFTLFENLTCVLEQFEETQVPEGLLPEALLPQEKTLETPQENALLKLNDWDKMDDLVRALRKHFKIMIPYLPQLSRMLSPRKSIYFLHMLWYIREYMDGETGIAKFRSKYMAYYMSMSPRTEKRLRDFFVGQNVFECIYDRKTHILHMSVNWEGLNVFLMGIDPTLEIFPQKAPKLKEETTPEPPKPAKPKEPFQMTKEHTGCFKWFDNYIHKDPKILSPSQVTSALEDLGKVRLFTPQESAGGFKYILYDNNHALKPYLNAAGMDAFFVLEAITQTHPNLIPSIRPLNECPDYYYKGDNILDPNWTAREKVTYAFTKRIAHLMGFDSYASIAGHMSIVEWNQNTLLQNEKTTPEFLIATRNGPMAAILGVFFTHLMHRFKDNFRFHIVPLEPVGILSP